jgi:hypothetical protein
MLEHSKLHPVTVERASELPLELEGAGVDCCHIDVLITGDKMMIP